MAVDLNIIDSRTQRDCAFMRREDRTMDSNATGSISIGKLADRLGTVDFQGFFVQDRRTGRYVDAVSKFRTLLTWQTRPSKPEQRGAAWAAACKTTSAELGLTRSIEILRDIRRGFGSLPEAAGLQAIVDNLKTLDTANKKFLRSIDGISPDKPYEAPEPLSPWSRREERTAKQILQWLENNAQATLSSLRQRYADEVSTLEWIEVRVQQLTRALWSLHEHIAQFAPRNFVEQVAMREALACMLDDFPDQSKGLKVLLKHFAQDTLAEARDVVLQSFRTAKTSRFYQGRYRWYPRQKGEFSGDLAADLVLIKESLEQFSPLAQSFVTVSALYMALRDVPRRFSQEWWAAPFFGGQDPLLRVIICELDFAGTPAVMPQNFPLDNS